MDVTINPTLLRGKITPPPSKSQAHRLIIAAAFSDRECVISNVAFSQDILATLNAMTQLGASWERVDEQSVRIRGVRLGTPVLQKDGLPHLDCGESGSTLRFLIPIALAVAGGGVFTGHGRLMHRPQQPYIDLFKEKDIEYTLENEHLTVRGTLTSGTYALPGNVSSQFFTGLLYALSLVDGESHIVSTTELESRSYIDLTIDALSHCGVDVKETDEEYPAFSVIGGKHISCPDCSVENDWSQAGFYYAAQGTGNELCICGMNQQSKQGDRAVARQSSMLKQSGEVILDVSDCPDLVPPLAVQAALRGLGNVTRIEKAARLRMKESDRLTAVTKTLNAMGANIKELEDGLVITGVDTLEGSVEIDSFNDHRIAMMAAVGATRCRKPITILGADCVKKSYPNFWEDYEMLGGKIRREETT